jgi:hypothetical protein
MFAQEGGGEFELVTCTSLSEVLTIELPLEDVNNNTKVHKFRFAILKCDF